MKHGLLLATLCLMLSERTATADGATNGAIRVEAECAELAGNLKVANGRAGYSGTGYVTGFNQSTDNKFRAKVQVPKA